MDRILLPGRSHLLVGLPPSRRVSVCAEASGFDSVPEFTDNPRLLREWQWLSTTEHGFSFWGGEDVISFLQCCGLSMQ